MKKIIITESQYKRIFKQTINEQVHTWTTNQSSKQLYNIFFNEYLPTIVGDYKQLTYNQYNTKLKSLMSNNFDGIIDFFAKKGYKQPNKTIKLLQDDLMSNTNVEQFRTNDEKQKPFNDGVFGAATAKVLINMKMGHINKYMISKNKGDVVMAQNTTTANAGKDAIPMAKVKTKQVQGTGTGAQTLKNQ